jgi:nucleotide sugar dehydrogenase
MLRAGRSHVFEPGLEGLLKAQLANGHLTIAKSAEELAAARVYIVCVGTPLQDGVPYLGSLIDSISSIAPGFRHGDLVVLRSTVPVGTCRGIVAREIQRGSGLTPGAEVGIAFAPERTVEGRALQELRTLPQVIAAIDDWSAEATARIFSRMTSSIVRVDQLEEAEFVKLVNNGFRDLSFAFSNEIALMCEGYNLDARRVIDAANLGYPRNPVALPSPGVGGSCLVKDPYLLATTPSPRPGESLAVVGRRINEFIPIRVADRVLAALEEGGTDLGSATIFVVGFAFKGEPETADMRDSPTLDLLAALKSRVKQIRGFDPVVSRGDIERAGIEWMPLAEGFRDADAVIVMTNAPKLRSFDVRSHAGLLRKPAVFFDGWRMFNREDIEGIPGLRYMTLGYSTHSTMAAEQEECVSA